MNNKNVRYNRNKKFNKRKKFPVTVCIAAIYNNNAILCASDRMVTGGYGDITFEPPVPKIIRLTNSIAVLTAGDQSIQSQVFQKTLETIVKKITTEPDQTKLIDISYAADVYSKCFYDLRNKMIENRVLSPYNLTFNSFYAKQKEMSKTLINMITDKINRFVYSLEGIETIIAGIDGSIPFAFVDDLGKGTSPHIYVIRDGEISCHDKLGFAPIGIGSYHVISHFMLSEYSRLASEAKALLTIHQAKKKAEVSPGVGKATDMCVIGPKKNSLNMITKPPFVKDIVDDLDKSYGRYKRKIKRIDKLNESKMADYLKELASMAPSTQQVTPSPSPSPEAELESEEKK